MGSNDRQQIRLLPIKKGKLLKQFPFHIYLADAIGNYPKATRLNSVTFKPPSILFR